MAQEQLRIKSGLENPKVPGYVPGFPKICGQLFSILKITMGEICPWSKAGH